MKSKQFTIPSMPSSTSFCAENDSIDDFHFKQEKRINVATSTKKPTTKRRDIGNDSSNDNNNKSRSLLSENVDDYLPCIGTHMDDKAMLLGTSLSSIETIKVHNVNTHTTGKSSSRKLSSSSSSLLLPSRHAVKLKQGNENKSVSDISLNALYPNGFKENSRNANDMNKKSASLDADSQGSKVFVPPVNKVKHRNSNDGDGDNSIHFQPDDLNKHRNEDRKSRKSTKTRSNNKHEQMESQIVAEEVIKVVTSQEPVRIEIYETSHQQRDEKLNVRPHKQKSNPDHLSHSNSNVSFIDSNVCPDPVNLSSDYNTEIKIDTRNLCIEGSTITSQAKRRESGSHQPQQVVLQNNGSNCVDDDNSPVYEKLYNSQDKLCDQKEDNNFITMQTSIQDDVSTVNKSSIQDDNAKDRSVESKRNSKGKSSQQVKIEKTEQSTSHEHQIRRTPIKSKKLLGDLNGMMPKITPLITTKSKRNLLGVPRSSFYFLQKNEAIQNVQNAIYMISGEDCLSKKKMMKRNDGVVETKNLGSHVNETENTTTCKISAKQQQQQQQQQQHQELYDQEFNVGTNAKQRDALLEQTWGVEIVDDETVISSVTFRSKESEVDHLKESKSNISCHDSRMKKKSSIEQDDTDSTLAITESESSNYTSLGEGLSGSSRAVEEAIQPTISLLCTMEEDTNWDEDDQPNTSFQKFVIQFLKALELNGEAKLVMLDTCSEYINRDYCSILALYEDSERDQEELDVVGIHLHASSHIAHQFLGVLDTMKAIGPREEIILYTYGRVLDVVYKHMENYILQQLSLFTSHVDCLTPSQAANIICWYENYLNNIGLVEQLEGSDHNNQQQQGALSVTPSPDWWNNINRVLHYYLETSVRQDTNEILMNLDNNVIRTSNYDPVGSNDKMYEDTNLRCNKNGYIITSRPEEIVHVMNLQLNIAIENLPRKYVAYALQTFYDTLSAIIVNKQQMLLGDECDDNANIGSKISASRYCAIINDSIYLLELLQGRNAFFVSNYIDSSDTEEKTTVNTTFRHLENHLSEFPHLAIECLCRDAIFNVTPSISNMTVDLSNLSLHDVGSNIWEESIQDSIVLIATDRIQQNFGTFEKCLYKSKQYYPIIVSNCFLQIIQKYVQSFYKNTMYFGIKNPTNVSQKLIHDSSFLSDFFQDNIKLLNKYSVDKNIMLLKMNDINSSLQVVKCMARIVDPNQSPKNVIDDISYLRDRILIIGQNEDSFYYVTAILHLAGLRTINTLHKRSDSIQWIHSIASAEATAVEFSRKTTHRNVKFIVKLNDLMRSPFIYKIRVNQEDLENDVLFSDARIIYAQAMKDMLDRGYEQLLSEYLARKQQQQNDTSLVKTAVNATLKIGDYVSTNAEKISDLIKTEKIGELMNTEKMGDYVKQSENIGNKLGTFIKCNKFTKSVFGFTSK